MSLMIKDKTGEIVKVAGNSGGGASDADKVKYDNVTSGLEATNVQSAVDELAENKADKTEISSVENRLNTRIDVALGDMVKAPQVAEVGQILAVKAVDDEGKPTEWKTVDGGGDGFNYPDEIAMPGDQLYVKEIGSDGKPTAWSYNMHFDPSKLSYAEIAHIVRNGKAKEAFKIGDQIMTIYTDTEGNQYEMPWDIVAFREVELEDGSIVPGMIIQSHYATVEEIQYDNKEPNSSDSNVKVSGWNRWSYSGIRQWLNSDADKGYWWTSTHDGDVAPTQHGTYNGFMKGFSADFIGMLKKTKHETVLNYKYPLGSETGYVYDTTYDVFFLPSVREEHFKYSAYPNRWDGSGREGTDWEYWIQRKGPTPIEYMTYDNKSIRYSLVDKTTAKTVRLRSAERVSSYTLYCVFSSGKLDGYGSGASYSVAPACIIC